MNHWADVLYHRHAVNATGPTNPRRHTIESDAGPAQRAEIVRGAIAQLVCYAAAIATAILVRSFLLDRHPLLIVLVADVAATLVVFGFSLAFRNSSLYDPYWSVQPVVIAAFWWWWPADAAPDELRRVVATVLLTLWAVRLTANFFYGWRGLSQEDWRYIDLQKANGRGYWLVSLTGIHLFPTLLVFAACIPLMPALNTGGRPWNILDTVAAVITVLAIALETIADWQLHRFVRTNRVPGKTLDTGLWAWSRHPNYLGEILLWWGIALFGFAAGGPAWIFTGAIAITILFVFISIPMIEKRSLQRRPHYTDYQRRVPRLIPFPK